MDLFSTNFSKSFFNANFLFARKELNSKVAVQRNAMEHFGVEFETVVGGSDFASKSYFSADLICKIRRERSYVHSEFLSNNTKHNLSPSKRNIALSSHKRESAKFHRLFAFRVILAFGTPPSFFK